MERNEKPQSTSSFNPNHWSKIKKSELSTDLKLAGRREKIYERKSPEEERIHTQQSRKPIQYIHIMP